MFSPSGDLAGLMWSSRPLSDCWLKESGLWIDVPDTHVEIMITNEVVSLISYSLVAVASKPHIPGSSFLGERQHGLARKDFLQVKVLHASLYKKSRRREGTS